MTKNGFERAVVSADERIRVLGKRVVIDRITKRFPRGTTIVVGTTPVVSDDISISWLRIMLDCELDPDSVSSFSITRVMAVYSSLAFDTM